MIRVFCSIYNYIMKVIHILILAMMTVTLQGFDNGQVNFQGDFDSMHTGTPQAEPEYYDQGKDKQSQELGEVYQEQEQDMLEFSEYMADFIPDQTFTFELTPAQTEEFMIWPSVEVQTIRGMFHSQVQDDDNYDGYVNLALFDNTKLLREYKQQRLGIFNIQHTNKDSRYTLKFQNGQANLDVYFSYELVTKQKMENKAPKNESEIEAVTRQFQKVNRLIVQQEAEMSRLIGISERHQEKIDEYLSSVQWTLLFETMLICFGNIASLLLLKRQIYAGYQLLV